MNKLQAFTLIEILVAMAVSGIVIAASYFSFSAVTGQMNRYRSATGRMMDIVQFQSLLERDIRSALFMKRAEGDGVELGSKGGAISRYHVSREYVLRIQGTSYDTLKMQVKATRFSFRDKDAEIGSLVDRIFLELGMPDTIYPVVFNKEYGADVLLEAHSQNQNHGD